MTLRINMAFESIFVFTLLPAKFAEVFEPSRRHIYNRIAVQTTEIIIVIWNTEMNPRRQSQSQEELRKLRQEIAVNKQEEAALLADKKALIDRIQHFNTKAVFCIEGQQWQHALLYLEETQRLLQSAAEKGHQIDQCIVQCVLHNEACCFQNLWQLQKCSNYLQALIFNLNNQKKGEGFSHAQKRGKEELYSKYGLAKYYLQFCAINSQIDNHSGALISARKAQDILLKELLMWQKVLESKTKTKNRNQYEQKLRLLDIICNFNGNPNLQMNQVLMEAASYFLKLYHINLSGTKSWGKDLRQMIEAFTMKSIMQMQSITYQDYINTFHKQCDLSLYALFERILLISVCFFTMATELRLICLKKSKDNSIDKNSFPQHKQSESYHLFAIIILTLTILGSSQYLAHLLKTYQDHYGNDLVSLDFGYKKIYTDIITLPATKKIGDTSIIYSEQDEGLHSHISKGSGTLIRFTKSSKQSEKDKKLSWIEPKHQNKQSTKNSKSKSKRKQSSSKPKKQSSSLSKSPYPKSPHSKQSYLIKSPKSPKTKQSIPLKSPINSLKHISNPIRMKLNKKSNEKVEKTHSKSKKKKVQSRINEYFLETNVDKRNKKTSVSSKKSSSQPRSTGRLPINSTLQAKDMLTIKQKKKISKKSLLQHYL